MGPALGSVAAAAPAAALLWLVSHCYLPMAVTQMTTSGLEDGTVLLEAMAAAAGSAPVLMRMGTGAWGRVPICGDGYDSLSRGWWGVECDVRGGRAVLVLLTNTDIEGELLLFFGRLGALRALELPRNAALSGDLADLAGAIELRSLNLHDCPLVVGTVGALAVLVHLGEEYTLRSHRFGHLYMARSGVHGAVAALRALPGLGADWGSAQDDFSPCSAFGDEGSTGSLGCAARGLEPEAVRSRNAQLPYSAAKFRDRLNKYQTLWAERCERGRE